LFELNRKELQKTVNEAMQESSVRRAGQCPQHITASLGPAKKKSENGWEALPIPESSRARGPGEDPKGSDGNALQSQGRRKKKKKNCRGVRQCGVSLSCGTREIEKKRGMEVAKKCFRVRVP